MCGVLTRTLVALLVVSATFAGCLTAPVKDAPEAQDPWRPSHEARLTPDDASASEVSIAADPTDPAHFVAAANSAGGFGVYETFDAGANWSATRLTAADVDPTGVRFTALSDPVVAFGPDGALYLAGLAYLPASSVFVAASPSGDAGAIERVVVVHESDLASSFNDKEWLGVDPETGTLILTWQKEPAMDQLRGVEALVDDVVAADLDLGDIVVSRSTDEGRTWTEPVKVSRGMHNNGTQVAWTPSGSAHLLWVNYEEGVLDHAKSVDGGITWSEPSPVAEVHIVPAFPRYARMHTLPALVASPVSDALYAVWHDKRDGDADVYAVSSPDDGGTWSGATRVNQDTPGNGAVQFYPWAAVDPAGRLHVTFYDARDDDRPRFVLYHAVATGPSLDIVEMGPVSGAAFTAFDAPGGDAGEARGLGDYTGVAASERGVVPAWADGRGETSAIFAVRLDPPAPGSVDGST